MRAFSYIDDVAPIIARGPLVPAARNKVPRSERGRLSGPAERLVGASLLFENLSEVRLSQYVEQEA